MVALRGTKTLVGARRGMMEYIAAMSTGFCHPAAAPTWFSSLVCVGAGTRAKLALTTQRGMENCTAHLAHDIIFSLSV
jgi:hypothetical protein